MNINKSLLLLYFVFILMGVNLSVIAQPYDYALFQVPGFDGAFGTFTEVWDVNDNGILAGDSFPTGVVDFHTFVSNGRQYLDLGTFGGEDSMAWGINKNNIVVGWSQSTIARRAFKWSSKNGMVDLGDLGGLRSEAYGINNAGQICGLAHTNSELPHAFLWEDNVIIDLGVLDSGLESEAFGINELGVIVGESMNADGIYRPVMWKDGQIIDLGSLGDGMNRGNANGINDFDQVVGQSWDEKDNRPFIWDNGNIFALSHLAGFARDINNQGQVVGAVFQGQKDLGFIWEQSKGLRFLEDLLPPGINFRIGDATGISEGGIISANGPNPSCGPFCNRAFMLVPVKPEMVLSDPVPGVAGVVNSWTVTGAAPGAKVTFVYGFKGGGTRVPGCDVLDAAVQIDGPKVVKTVVADGNGVAKLDMLVPNGAKGLGGILVQAVSLDVCQESQLTVVNFQ